MNKNSDKNILKTMWINEVQLPKLKTSFTFNPNF
jgi:hypothetical protein